MTVPVRAGLYLRVSTARQAEHDVSIPDQKRQGEAYCVSRGYQLAETYVEPGASATHDRRPELQRMIEAGTNKPAPFDVVNVQSFSRFFRDHFELEFYLRRLAKNGVRLVSTTQEMGDDPMHVMMRQIMALFHEYQSKENAKHVLRTLKENARQGFWNGSLPPIGNRVVAAEQRGAKVKKKLKIDPLHADTVGLIYRLALEWDGTSGQMGVKNNTAHLNRQRIFTRDGGRWGIGQVHRILTRATYSRPKPTPTAPMRWRKAWGSRRSPPPWSRSSPGRPASASGSTAAATAANTSAPWLSGWRWPKRKCGSWGRRAICSERLPPLRA